MPLARCCTTFQGNLPFKHRNRTKTLHWMFTLLHHCTVFWGFYIDIVSSRLTLYCNFHGTLFAFDKGKYEQMNNTVQINLQLHLIITRSIFSLYLSDVIWLAPQKLKLIYSLSFFLNCLFPVTATVYMPSWERADIFIIIFRVSL